jgi:enoyl-CoA hydratase/carnithine racemase
VSEPCVLVDRADGVGRIMLNRPEAMNAITVDLGRALADAITGLAHEPGQSL